MLNVNHRGKNINELLDDTLSCQTNKDQKQRATACVHKDRTGMVSSDSRSHQKPLQGARAAAGCAHQWSIVQRTFILYTSVLWCVHS